MKIYVALRRTSLVACTRLYTPLCWSVCPSVTLSFFFYIMSILKSFLVILCHSRSIYVILSYIMSLKSIRSLSPFSCILTFPEEVLSVLYQTCQFISKQARDWAKVTDGWAGSVVQNYSTTVFHNYISYNNLSYFKHGQIHRPRGCAGVINS